MNTDWRFPVDPERDYRHGTEERLYGFMAWVEANYDSKDLVHPIAVVVNSVGSHDIEDLLWAAFLWGACYNVIGPYTILQNFPKLPQDNFDEFYDWYNSEFDRFRVDTDCRHRKSKMIPCIESYISSLGEGTQYSLLRKSWILDDPKERYFGLHKTAMSWKYFGRLAVWNYLEALSEIQKTGGGKEIDCQDFLLTDLSGSESNRNGLCCATSNEDLYTKHGKYIDTGLKMDKAVAVSLNLQADYLFDLCKDTLGDKYDIKRLSLETCFCWWKKKFSRSRDSRYLGWFGDSTSEEFVYLRKAWPELNTAPLEYARLVATQPILSFEGADKEKMKVFHETGLLTDIYKYQIGERYELV